MQQIIEEKLYQLNKLNETAHNKKILLEEMRIVSEKAFENLRFVSYEPGDYSVYYPRRMVRDARLRANLKRLAERDEFGALYMRDIIREGVLSNDSRLR